MITFEHVHYTYPQGRTPALKDVNLHLPEGSFALVVGASGAGKSTLLRCTNGLVPHFSGGTLSGKIRIKALDPVAVTPQRMSNHVGFVFQDPESQFVMDRVEDEIAFALENASLPRAAMRVRVAEALSLLDLTPLRDRRIETLSGGERQRVAIAAALALRPQLLVLDEPTSQLDPKSAEDVLQSLTRLNRDLGLTILLAEHRLERVLPFADVLVYLPGNGAGAVAGPPRELLEKIDLTPPLVTLGKALDWKPLPLTIKEGRVFAQEISPTVPPQALAESPNRSDSPYIQAREVDVSYNGHAVLHQVSIELWPNEITVLMGRNGAGKTTLLKSMVGLVHARRGRIEVAGRNIAGRQVAEICRQVGYLPQDPNTLLFADTVREELNITLRNHGLREDDGGAGAEAQVVDLLERLGLGEEMGVYPRDLSVGQRQRVALGAITVTQPGALLLDEPTRGLDYQAKKELTRLLRTWRDNGMAILLVTHDVELAASVADRVALMDQGEIIMRGDPGMVLGSSPLFAPQVARLFPGTGWLTPEDVLRTHPTSKLTRISQ